MRRVGKTSSIGVLFLLAGLSISGLPVTCQAADRQVEIALRRGADFLASQQSRLGAWNSNSYPTAVTALSGHALLATGSTLNRGKHSLQVARAVGYLTRTSQPTGLIGSSSDPRYIFGHGLALMFLGEVFGDEDDSDRRDELQRVIERGIQFAARSQTRSGGWGYISAAAGNQFDEGAATAVVRMGLRSCQQAGFAVPRLTMKRAEAYMKSCMNADGGIFYSSKTRSSSRFPITAAELAASLSPGGNYTDPQRKSATKQVQTLVVAGGPSRDFRHLVRFLAAQSDYRTDVLLQTTPPNLDNVIQVGDTILSSWPTKPHPYQVIVAFDPDWSQLSPDQLRDLVDWVDRGGKLVFVAGDAHTRSLAEEPKLGRLRDLLPVRLLNNLISQELAPPATKPLALSTSGDQAPRWLDPSRLALYRTYPALAVKRGTVHLIAGNSSRESVVRPSSVPSKKTADAINEIKESVVFASRTYGQGTVLYWGSPELWRLRQVGPAAYHEFWSNLVSNYRSATVKRTRQPIQWSADQQRMRKYCQRHLGNRNFTGHDSFARLYMAHVMQLESPDEFRRYFSRMSETLLRLQTQEGSWTDQIGKDYGTALAILALSTDRHILAFYHR